MLDSIDAGTILVGTLVLSMGLSTLPERFTRSTPSDGVVVLVRCSAKGLPP